MSVLNQATEIWNRMPVRGRVMTAVATAATMILAATIIYYGSQDEYAVLFSDLKPENASVIVEKLEAEGVPHSTTNGGTTIEIPRNRISEMRLKMAGSGVLSGGHVGFDLFDKTSFGATDFAQQINFRRAVEGELARTLEGMDEVESARVHVTPRKESVFSQKEEGAKASIMLRIRQGNNLAADRTDAIVALVSSSVEGLDPSAISVLDTRGRLLTAASNKAGKSDAGNFSEQLESKRKFETEAAARVIALLAPIAGDGGVMADVSADVDFSQVETTEEKYDPQSQVVRSQKTASEKSEQVATSPANNIAGARGNDPAIPASQTIKENKQSGKDERAGTTTNYEIDRTITRTVGAGGKVSRLNVSVVVDHKTVQGKRVARTANELSQIESLVTAAVGIDSERGDTVVVQTMPFDQGDLNAEAAAATFLTTNKELVATGIKYGILVLVFALLFLFVFRPAKKALRAAIAAQAGSRALGDGESGTLGDERRLNAAPDDANAAGVEGPMTVAQLESQMNGSEQKSGSAAEGSEAARQLEAMKQILTEGGNSSSEVVVGTLRGWLRE